MLINLVVAATENNVIGKDNKMPWHLPNDMTFFKNTTWGMPVIMGRKTYESMKPLNGRKNIVITRSNQLDPENEKAVIAPDMEHALKFADQTDANECYIIGGGEIFRQSMDIADRIYMTRVHTQLDGDIFFPDIDPEKWALKSEQHFDADSRHAYSYTFQTWEPKNRLS